MPELSELDRRVLGAIQSGFPVSQSPYCDLGEALGVPEMDVLNAVLCLRETGVIRRVGAVFDSHRLGYRSTLCGAAVPPGNLDAAAEVVNAYPNVTHNYVREDRYNMWFTLIAPSRERIEEMLAEIGRRTGVTDILDLPAVRLFKIRVDFDVAADSEQDGDDEDAPEIARVVRPAEVASVALSEDEKELVRFLQDDLPTGEHPFEEIAAALQMRGADVTEAWVLGQTRAWLDAGVIRRFGAAIRHHAAGFGANAMGVWACPDARVEEVGTAMAGFREVSHCYERPSRPTWPWNLYTMIHGRSTEECEQVASGIQQATGLEPPRLLYSVRELKKTSMRYFDE